MDLMLCEYTITVRILVVSAFVSSVAGIVFVPNQRSLETAVSLNCTNLTIVPRGAVELNIICDRSPGCRGSLMQQDSKWPLLCECSGQPWLHNHINMVDELHLRTNNVFNKDPDVSFPMDDMVGLQLLGTVNGTVVGNAPLVPGPVNKAMYFDGSTQYVDFGDRQTDCFSNPDKCGNGITYSMWMMARPQGTRSNILGGGGYDALSVGYALVLETDRRIRFRALTMNRTYKFNLSSFVLNQWVHIAFTWSHAQGLQVYVNGCPVDPRDNTATADVARAYPFSIYRPYILGAKCTKTFHAHVLLDNIRVWYEVVPTEEVWQLYLQDGLL